MKPITPHSRPGKLAILDGRRAEARRMKEIRLELAQHVGGKPSATQRLLIDRVAMMMLRMELMDKEALNGTPMADRDQRAYLGWANAVSRALRHLGLKGVDGKAPGLADYLNARRDTP
ncbi:MAG: hypothetical protein KGH75_09725 [Rhodospirillales bacterium]|nr:hypothetical protein [Rhodospirillales bacterium]